MIDLSLGLLVGLLDGVLFPSFWFWSVRYWRDSVIGAGLAALVPIFIGAAVLLLAVRNWVGVWNDFLLGVMVGFVLGSVAWVWKTGKAH